MTIDPDHKLCIYVENPILLRHLNALASHDAAGLFFFTDQPDNPHRPRLSLAADLGLGQPLRLGTLYDWLANKAANRWSNLPEMIPLKTGDLSVTHGYFIPAGDDKPINLTERELDVLCALYVAPNQTMDKDLLLRHVWGYVQGVETHTLETHIYRLRQKIEQNPAQPQNLLTLPLGYCLQIK